MTKEEGWRLFFRIRDRLRKQAECHALMLFTMAFFFIVTWLWIFVTVLVWG